MDELYNNEDVHTKLLVPENDHHHDHNKGGMKTMPFIIVNEAFAEVASYGLLPNMIFYLMEVYHMEAATGASIVSLWSSLSNGLSIFGAVISDSYFGRFRVIIIGSFSTLLGTICLWFTTIFPQLTPSYCHELDPSCTPPTLAQLGFLLSSLGLISIGSGCIAPCSIAFGADQLKHHPNPRIIASYFNWYYASTSASAVIAFTLVVYVQDQFGWRVGFAVPILIMFCSAFMFLLGSQFYIKVEVSQGPFSGLFQVLMLAFRNRKISFRRDDRYNHSSDSGVDRVEITESLRFLNKACVIRDSNTDSSGLNPSTISTVENVESLKSLIRLVPIWSSCILLFTVSAQNFPTLQAKAMNRHITSWFEIPAGSFNVFIVLALTSWIVLYNCILVPTLEKHTHQPRWLHPKTRMGFGLLILVGAMVVSAIVETVRRDLARSAENLKSKTDMSAMWLVPQYVLLGLAQGLNAVGQTEFYYSELPGSMSSVAVALTMVSMAVSGLVASALIEVVDLITSLGGKVSWLSTDINEGHLDYYYLLLGFLSLLNFFYFLICCRASAEKSKLSDEAGEEPTNGLT